MAQYSVNASRFDPFLRNGQIRSGTRLWFGGSSGAGETELHRTKLLIKLLEVQTS